jgi:transcriptional regulator
LTQTEIAAAVGCTAGYIGQIERRALRKIKREFDRRIAAGTFSSNLSFGDMTYSLGAIE